MDEMPQPRALSSYKYLLILAQLLHGAGATPIYTLAVTYLDENLKAKMTPMYVGELDQPFIPLRFGIRVTQWSTMVQEWKVHGWN